MDSHKGQREAETSVCVFERERERDLLRTHMCTIRKGFPKELEPCRRETEGSERGNIPSGGDRTVWTKAEKRACGRNCPGTCGVRVLFGGNVLPQMGTARAKAGAVRSRT